MALKCNLSDWETNVKAFEHIVQDPHNWNQIPLINTIPNYELQDLQLVRFRGMVQYMHNPEYFMGQYEVEDKESKVKTTRSGRYRDVIQCSPTEYVIDKREQSIEERQVYYCITTPALNDWQERKLGLQFRVAAKAPNVCNTSTKRSAECELMDVDHAAQNEGTCSEPSTSAPNAAVAEPKRLSAGNSKTDLDAAPSCNSLNLNFPVEGSEGIACLVKVLLCFGITVIEFEINDSDNLPPLKLNDLIDVVGFLSLDPSLAHVSSNMNTPAENMAENPPPSIVPRLHAVALRKIIHLNSIPNNLGSALGPYSFVEKLPII
ncbi:Mini-chromosome maintenance complex-binding protein [Frankliniella fusca]|uniref:Mini-chromosome maintenance complex-binding protein n=1 Tax=Frankliniella fusca TaxID=407009 RepID=A0AAE1LJ20_9NEOP|nr:Mini-chromosome maintenance complex-binding protein [Frankliniella fusca]